MNDKDIKTIAFSLERIAESITPDAVDYADDHNGHVRSLTEAVISHSLHVKCVAEGAYEIAAALREVAKAIRGKA